MRAPSPETSEFTGKHGRARYEGAVCASMARLNYGEVRVISPGRRRVLYPRLACHDDACS